jgi:eukaryotic-like serine/threonine-protein kinase
MAEHPQSIGKYRITRSLGKGAMGMVYEGFDPVIERKVAIKTILSDYLDASEMEDAIARFKREAQAGGRLQHPGIVGVYEYGGDGHMAFIVMEYVEGEELKRMLASGHRFELIEVFEIMKQLLGALDYSHKQGVVHRDIKPANLMIMPGPKVKVMDFGIARLESSNLTQVGTVVGTPTHMSPEQLMGITADGRADIWSSGVILYELLTGLSPFLAETPATVMHRVLQTEVERPSVINPALPPGFDAVVARALAKKADERFQTAREFQAALLGALQGKTLGGMPTGARKLDPDRSQRAATAVRKAPALSIPPEALEEIERSLSRHVGPLAKVLVKRTQGEVATIEELFKALSENIPNEEEQAAFMKKMASVKAAAVAAPAAPAAVEKTAIQKAAPSATRTAFTPEVLAAAEKRLASYVGPLAKILIRDAAGKSGNLKELYTQLADHIDSEEERRDFLASLPR